MSLANQKVISLFRDSFKKTIVDQKVTLTKVAGINAPRPDDFTWLREKNLILVTSGTTSEYTFSAREPEYAALKYLTYLQEKSGKKIDTSGVPGLDPVTGKTGKILGSAFFEILAAHAALDFIQQNFAGNWLYVPSPKPGPDGGADFFLVRRPDGENKLFGSAVVIGQAKLYGHTQDDAHFRSICRDIVGTAELFRSVDYADKWTSVAGEINGSIQKNLLSFKEELKKPFLNVMPCVVYLGGSCRESVDSLGSPIILSHTQLTRYISKLIRSGTIQNAEDSEQMQAEFQYWFLEKMFEGF